MAKPIVTTLPARPPKREFIFAIRLTATERDQIESLAQRLKLPDSFMARHFILEAVAHHSTVQTEDVELESQSTGAK